MKKFSVKKKILLLVGFALLAALPFAIVHQPVPLNKNDTINPYPEPADPAAALIQKASENYFYHEFDQGAENYQMAIALYEERGDMTRVAKIYESLGDLYVWGHDPEAAEKSYLQAVKTHADNRDVLGQANALKEIGDLNMKQDRLQKAEDWYRQSLAVLKEEEPNRVTGSVHEGIGHMYWQAEKIPEAIESFTQAQAIFATLHYQMGVDHITNVLHRLNNISDLDLKAARHRADRSGMTRTP